MIVISHRGAGILSPENSLASIRIANNLNVGAIEIDIRLTKDNQFVVFHDKNLIRLAKRTGKIRDLSLDELQQIRLKNDALIPELNITKRPLVIELKDKDWSTLFYEYMLQNRLDPYRVISFNKNELIKFKALSPNTDCYLNNYNLFKSFRDLKTIRQNNINGITVQFLALNPIFYIIAKKHHIKINVFIINNLNFAKIITRFYPDIEITTNRPDKLQILNTGPIQNES
jgi:glycerophosphoryl diester phosphodiesterase